MPDSNVLGDLQSDSPQKELQVGPNMNVINPYIQALGVSARPTQPLPWRHACTGALAPTTAD